MRGLCFCIPGAASGPPEIVIDSRGGDVLQVCARELIDRLIDVLIDWFQVDFVTLINSYQNLTVFQNQKFAWDIDWVAVVLYYRTASQLQQQQRRQQRQQQAKLFPLVFPSSGYGEWAADARGSGGSRRQVCRGRRGTRSSSDPTTTNVRAAAGEEVAAILQQEEGPFRGGTFVSVCPVHMCGGLGRDFCMRDKCIDWYPGLWER